MKKFLKILSGLILSMVLVLSALIGYFFYIGIEEANRYESQHSLVSLADNVMQSSDYVSENEVPAMLYEATISIEDARFEKHGAVEVSSLLRGALSQVFPQWLERSGGSTITMQVVKNLYGVYDGGLRWKAAEIVLAHRLFERYSRQEILNLYISIINYGDGEHGIKDAAAFYYGIAPIQLSDGMSTILAGIPQAPDAFSLTRHFEAARGKQQLVLSAMVRDHFINEAQAQEIYNQDCYPYHGIELASYGYTGSFKIVGGSKV